MRRPRGERVQASGTPPARSAEAASGGPEGFSLVEVLVALVIVSVAMMALAASSVTFLQTVSETDQRAAAVQLAEDRIATILADPEYDMLATRYDTTETGFTSMPNAVRTTKVVRFGGADTVATYTMIDVTVTGPAIDEPVTRTTATAPPGKEGP